MWDFRISADGLDVDTIKTQLRKFCKKFTFQLEQGEERGYLHYQARMSLIVRHRKNELMKFWDIMPAPNYLAPTANATYYTGNMFYVMKEETRVAGPWDDREETKKYIPRQYRGLLEQLRPFQRHIYDTADVFETRIINMIYDPTGNVGKSTVAILCELFGHGLDLPPVNDAEKIIQSCCDMCEAKDLRNPSPIFVDLPRAMNKERLNGIYTAIEQIKKGKLFDLRYKYKEYWIDSPQIWVFSNIEPDLQLLSRDRWKVWSVNESYELVPYQGFTLIL